MFSIEVNILGIRNLTNELENSIYKQERTGLIRAINQHVDEIELFYDKVKKVKTYNRELSDFNISDRANLASFCRVECKWELIGGFGEPIKVILNPYSNFEKRVAYIFNTSDYKELSKECPLAIIRCLRELDFNI